jgi:2-polyprenyl-6-methoxyphenol hydroxylase-like FAD-dependent oxidoreductase
MDRRRVLIVGGGIAGLALAPMLARTGVEVEVAERERAWRAAGTGIYLPGNAARALRALGLEAQVASRAVEIARQRFYDHRGRLLCEVDVAELWAAVGPCLPVHRAELHALLREAANDESIGTRLAVERLAQGDGIASVEFRRRNERRIRSRGRSAAPARYERDLPDPPHRLRHADLQGRRRAKPTPAGDRSPIRRGRPGRLRPEERWRRRATAVGL